ncbi:MAG: carbohydrate ABC transporter permease [Caldilineales bacterium]|nr:carbohydrate ABC transporter permease [Caldilineales bacterium]
MTTLAQAQPRPGGLTLTQQRRRTQQIFLYIFLTALTILWLLPIFAALITSLRTMDDIASNGFWTLPRVWTTDNFTRAWTAARVSKYLLNSFIITLPSLLGMLFLSSLAAYALARFRFRANLWIYFLFVAGTMLPFQILMLPVFRLTNKLGLYDTYGSLILIHTAFQIGFCTFVLRNLRTVPHEIMDAAPRMVASAGVHLLADGKARSPCRPWPPWPRLSSPGSSTTICGQSSSCAPTPCAR